MDQDAIVQDIRETFDGLEVVEADGNVFFFASAGNPPPDKRLPFATVVANDLYDQFSDLDRPGVFRLNIGVKPETYRALTGAGDEAAVDYTALDTIMPHPVYGAMFWLAVLNPSVETFLTVRPLLAEAYERAGRRQAKVAGRRTEGA